MRMTRRTFLSTSAVVLASGAACQKPPEAGREDGKDGPTSELDQANDEFLKGNYEKALARFSAIGARQPANSDVKFAIAACHVRLDNFTSASQALADASPASTEEWTFCAFVRAKSGDFKEAQRALSKVPDEEVAADIELMEALALAASRYGDRPAAWRYYRLIQKQHPGSSAIDRLDASGQFAFTHEWFGTGSESRLNYAKGFASGVVDWGAEIWELFRHPIRTVREAASAIAEILSPANLKLLFSPSQLVDTIDDVAAQIFWSSWEACKLSVVREFNLDAERFEDQQAIHEIAAGRMIGYVAPDLVLLVLPGGPFAKLLSKSEKSAKAAKTIGQTEQKLEKINQIARSGKFLADAKTYPKLRSIHWLSEGAWEALKASDKVASRIEQVVEWMSAVRHIPGAENLVKTIVGRLHLDDVEGYLYQLSRAAVHAREEKLTAIGKKFRVGVALPGKPVKIMLGDADLVLKDGILVETKYRKAALVLDEELNTQLLKYDRAVAEGQFKKVRLECNGPISQQVKSRCDVIATRGTPIELVENAAASS